MDESSAVKETRVVLRRIQDHLLHAHKTFGVEHESAGFVDVIHHPTNKLADLNYVTPRRNTAWVSGSYVQQGLDRLSALDRVGRVQYIEGLYPPQFAKTLRDLGLHSENESSLMAFSLSGFAGTTPSLPKPTTPRGVRLELAGDQRATEMWLYVHKNANYDLMTLGVEPLAVSREPDTQRLGHDIDLLLHKNDFPVGVVRLGVQSATQSAHIVALALQREARTPALTRLLMLAGMRAALARGCTMIFAPGENDADRALNRELGFVDVGSMVCYAAQSEKVTETQAHDSLVQPVLALRR
jgi:hypothetical protein